MADIFIKQVQGSKYNELQEVYDKGKIDLDIAYERAMESGNYSEVFDQFYSMAELKKRLEIMKVRQEEIAQVRYESIDKYNKKYDNWKEYMLSDDFQNSVNPSRTVYSLNPETFLGKAVDLIGDAATGLIQGYGIEGTTFGLSIPRHIEDIYGAGINKLYDVMGADRPEVNPALGIKSENGQIVPRYSTTPFDPNYSERAAEGKIFPNYEQIEQYFSQTIPGAKEAYDLDPSSMIGQYAQTIGSFITPLGIVGLPAKAQVFGGVVGGATSEFVSERTDNPLLNIGAPLAAIIAGNYAVGSQKSSILAAKTLKNISKEELLVAMEIEKMANQLNIPITTNELLDSGLLNSIFKTTAASQREAGLNIETYLKNRPQAFYDVANSLMDGILKDKNLALKLGYKDIQKMLLDTQKRIQKKRTLESQLAGYNVGDEVIINKDLIDDVIRKIDLELSAGGQNPAKVKLLKDFRISLHAGDGSVLTRTGDLSEPYRMYSELLNAKGDKALDSVLSSLLSKPNSKDGILDALTTALKTNKQWVAGNKRFEEMSKLVDDSFAYLKFADSSFNMDTIKRTLFDTDNVNVEDIKYFAELLRNNVKNNKNLYEKIGSGNDALHYVNFEDPFSTFVDLYMRNLFNKTFTSVSKASKGKIKPDAGFNFNKELFPTAAARENFDEMLRQIAIEQGKNADDLIKGWNNFSSIAEKTGAAVGGPKLKTSPTIASSLLRVGSFMYRVTLGRYLDKAVDTAALETFSKIFTNPNSIEALIELSKKPNNIAAVNAIVGVTAAATGTTATTDNFMSQHEYNILSKKLITENNLQENN